MTKDFNPIIFDAAFIEQTKAEFAIGKPYKHFVIDNFLNEDFANLLHDNFPTVEQLGKHYKGLNEKKSEGANFNDFHLAFTDLRNLLMSDKFAELIATLTGIEGVFVTDDNLGTGLHQGGNGSFLDIHIDFNIHAEKNVHRRLNLLIYMNKNWLPEYNGDLEMWNADMTKLEKTVAPLFNRCCVFETNEISYHGYSKKLNLPENVTRKSIYSYFYTEIRDNSVAYHDTIFKARPEESIIKKVGTTIKERLKNFIKAQLKKMRE